MVGSNHSDGLVLKLITSHIQRAMGTVNVIRILLVHSSVKYSYILLRNDNINRKEMGVTN